MASTIAMVDTMDLKTPSTDSASAATPLRRKRNHSPQFRQRLITQCRLPGASISRVALDNGVNANLLRKWISKYSDPAAPSVIRGPALLPIEVHREPHAAASSLASRAEFIRNDGQVLVEFRAASMTIRGAVDPVVLNTLIAALRTAQ